MSIWYARKIGGSSQEEQLRRSIGQTVHKKSLCRAKVRSGTGSDEEMTGLTNVLGFPRFRKEEQGS